MFWMSVYSWQEPWAAWNCVNFKFSEIANTSEGTARSGRHPKGFSLRAGPYEYISGCCMLHLPIRNLLQHVNAFLLMWQPSRAPSIRPKEPELELISNSLLSLTGNCRRWPDTFLLQNNKKERKGKGEKYQKEKEKNPQVFMLSQPAYRNSRCWSEFFGKITLLWESWMTLLVLIGKRFSPAGKPPVQDIQVWYSSSANALRCYRFS